eukprot:PLAT8500.1.p1 GENE.PLAT8500.1~~PLAT8500.1.p1  ORF type:complete len:313 (+),score=0.61 PLAT8500.1:27-965(+)
MDDPATHVILGYFLRAVAREGGTLAALEVQTASSEAEMRVSSAKDAEEAGEDAAVRLRALLARNRALDAKLSVKGVLSRPLERKEDSAATLKPCLPRMAKLWRAFDVTVAVRLSKRLKKAQHSAAMQLSWLQEESSKFVQRWRRLHVGLALWTSVRSPSALEGGGSEGLAAEGGSAEEERARPLFVPSEDALRGDRREKEKTRELLRARSTRGWKSFLHSASDLPQRRSRMKLIYHALQQRPERWLKKAPWQQGPFHVGPGAKEDVSAHVREDFVCLRQSCRRRFVTMAELVDHMTGEHGYAKRKKMRLHGV